jgi:hypothetical protein
MRLTTPPRKKYCYETLRGSQGPPRAIEPMMMMNWMQYIALCLCGLQEQAVYYSLKTNDFFYSYKPTRFGYERISSGDQ